MQLIAIYYREYHPRKIYSAYYEFGSNQNGTNSFGRNSMREAVTKKFIEFVNSQNILIEKLAVVGGTSLDPEVAYLLKNFPGLEIHFFDVDNSNNESNFHYCDLNREDVSESFNQYFDLVLSSQVIEHVWNHFTYFNFLVKIVKPGAFVWVNCPTSNMVHGSPDYYSAGMTSSYLAKNLELRNAKTLYSGQLGNQRFYLAIHLGRYWQTPRENRHPVTGYNFQKGSFLGVAKKFFLELPSRVLLIFFTNRNDASYDYSTESYIAVQAEVLKS
jgi:hypothetical protein